MSRFGRDYLINDVPVTPPDEVTWPPIVIGENLANLQVRSPYRRLEWIKHAGTERNGNLDWFTYDNTSLTSLVCTAPGNDAQWERYDDAVCQQVTARVNHTGAREIVATFLVRI